MHSFSHLTKKYTLAIRTSQRSKSGTLAGTQSQHHRSQPAKEPALPNASGTHSAPLDTVFSLTHPDEGRTYNMGFGKIRADVSRVSTFGSLCICMSSLTLNI